MMHKFLVANRAELVSRCRAKVALRPARGASDEELNFGISYFLDQLIELLRREQMGDPAGSNAISGPSGGENSSQSYMGEGASRHGRELSQQGFTVDQVVHDYGDLCQAITELSIELDVRFTSQEFKTLNCSLDNVIADAVKEFMYQRDFIAANREAKAVNLRLGAFAHELRNHLNSATLSLTAIREGNVGLNGATGAVLDRSLVGMGKLINHSLADVRMTAGMPVRPEVFSLSRFIEEVKLTAALQAGVEKCPFTVSRVDRSLAVAADRDLLSSAVGNLLQNAFKFTEPHTPVNLSAYASGDRVLIEVEDHCGGLLPSEAETMFTPYTQLGENKTGLGLGLSISRRSVEANQGSLSVRDVPGSGCVFTIDLPRHALAEVALS